MNAEVKVSVSVKSSYRDVSKLWKSTNVYTEDFQLVTDLDSYLTAIPSYVDNIYSYVANERSLPAEPLTHYTVRLGNPTHPTPAKGVIPLPKGHLDGALSDGEFTSADILKSILKNVIADLKSRAKY